MRKVNKSVIGQLKTELDRLRHELVTVQESLNQTERECDAVHKEASELTIQLREQEGRLEYANKQNDLLCSSLSKVEAAKEAAENAYERALGIVADRLTE